MGNVRVDPTDISAKLNHQVRLAYMIEKKENKNGFFLNNEGKHSLV